MIGDIIGTIGTAVMSNIINNLGNNEQPQRMEVVEKQVIVPQQPQQIPPINFNLTINVFSGDEIAKLHKTGSEENNIIDLK